MGGNSQIVAQANVAASISASRVAVALSGNLDGEESRDIAKGIREVINIFRDLEQGHTGQAAHRVQRFAELDSLAEVEASSSIATADKTTLSKTTA